MTFTNRTIKAYILNDTSREKHHAGCLLVMKNLKTLCKKYGIEILFSDKALRILLYCFIFYCGIQIIHHSIKTDPPVTYGFKAE